MNIYDFFNSPDVAAYCQSIGHTFNAVESAVMVSQSKAKTLAEKLAAYRTIIAEYPDMALPKGYNHDYYKSFHKALAKFIINEERLLEKFLSSIYIDVPVPFKRGDLVEIDDDGDGGYLGNVYVLQKMCRDDAEWNSKRIYLADLADMVAGVHYESDGLVECETFHFYPDLRYCRRELEGEQRILKYVSLYLQDKLCICGLLKIQKYLWADKIRSELKNDHDLKYQLEQIKDKLLKKKT